jgi:enamine deaminase RidA (YjgF/YER057c/UK114 family)
VSIDTGTFTNAPTQEIQMLTEQSGHVVHEPRAKAAHPLLPVAIGRANVLYAQGVRAGRWVFATGHLAQDFRTGIVQDVAAARNPHGGLPRHQKEAARIFDNINAVLEAGGTSLGSVVRLDQYYPDQRAVDPYHVVRRARFQSYVPPSTSMLMTDLLLPGAGIEVQAIAAVMPDGARPMALDRPDLRAPATSGFSPAVIAHEFAFLPGLVASAPPGASSRGGLALEACMPEGALWKGEPIKLEAEYVIEKKIKPSLELAGSGLHSVVKAQVYLTHVEDTAPFLTVWNRHFGESRPAVTIIPCANPGIGAAAARLEINLIAVRSGTATRISANGIGSYNDQPHAVRAADLLFLSGLMAADADGLVPGADVDAGQRCFGDAAEIQSEIILRRAAEICAAAGTELANITRAQLFLTDIRDFLSVYRAWQRLLPGRPMPYSAIQVPALPVPGARVQMDLWAYAP